MSANSTLLLAGIVTEAAVVGLLLYRHVWRKLPVFLVYCIWAFLSDAIAYAISFSRAGYDFKFYFVETVVDFALQFSVLIELAWSVLRPLRARLSRKALWVVATTILAVSGAIWPLAGISGLSFPSKAWHVMVQLQQTVSILRILFFLVLAGCSQLLSLGWRDRELQVATGFGFYSLVSIAVATLNSRLATTSQFKELYLVVALSFLCSMIYWVFSFAQPDAERREFTHQMQQTLLALARTARITRADLPHHGVAKPKDSNLS